MSKTLDLKLSLEFNGPVKDTEHIAIAVEEAIRDYIDNVGIVADSDETFTTDVKVLYM